MRSKFTFIFNPEAGHKHPKAIDTIESFIAKNNLKASIKTTKAKGHATELTLKAIQENTIPVAVGGDGTVNEVAQALIDSPYAMGIVPKGSGNGVARHLGISMNYKKALDTLLNGSIHNVDAGEVNRHPFVMLMGIGFDATVAKAMSKEARRGLTKYAKLSIQAFKSFEPLDLKFTVDGKAYQERAFMFNVSNASQFGNNFYHAPQADMQDGFLNLSLIKPFSAWLVPDIAWRMTQRKIESSAHYVGLPVKEVYVQGKIDNINLDGESVLVNDALHVKIHPASLHIIAP